MHTLTPIEQKILDFLKDTDNDPAIENDASTITDELSLSLNQALSALKTLEQKGLVAKSEIWTPTDTGLKEPHK